MLELQFPQRRAVTVGAIARRARAGVALFAVLTTGALAQQPPTPPREVMTSLAGELFAVLDRSHAHEPGGPASAATLVDHVLEPHFDRDYAARLVLGAHWRGASEPQQLRFATALYRTLLRTYAAEVATWTPDRLRILPLTTDPTALQALVRTEVTQPGRALAHVDYRLHSTTSGWRIFDVVVDGVSFARSYHDDIEAEVRRAGLDAAIAGLEERASGARRPLTETRQRPSPR
jgi:phospholipid transport system substrate-binding protein